MSYVSKWNGIGPSVTMWLLLMLLLRVIVDDKV